MAKVLPFGLGCDISEISMNYFVDKLIKSDHKFIYAPPGEIIDSYVLNADYIVLNSCITTGEHLDTVWKNLKTIASIKRPESKVLIVGCINRMPKYVDLIKKYFPDFILVSGDNWPLLVESIINFEEKPITESLECACRTDYPFDTYVDESAYKCFLITRGCRNKCTFCKACYMNLELNSLPIEIIFRHIDRLVAEGVIHIYLVGENITQYGVELYNKPRLHEILKYMANIPDIKFITLSDVTVQDSYPELLEELAVNKKICKVVVQPQMTDDLILRLMGRNHNVAGLDNFIYNCKRNENLKLLITAMVGFPTTTMDHIRNLMQYATKNELELIRIYCYSNSNLVPSSQYPQVPEEEKRLQYQLLSRFQREHNYRLYQSYNPLITKGYVMARQGDATIIDLGLSNNGVIYNYDKDIPIGTEINIKGTMLTKNRRFINGYAYLVK